LLFVGALVLFFEFVVPLATSEIRTLLEDEAQLKKRVYAGLVNLQSLARGVLPESVVLGELAPDKNLARIEEIAGSLLPTDFAWLGDALTYAIITPILTFIFLLQGQEIYRSLIGMVPNRYFEMAVALVNNMRNQIIAYLRGLSMQWLIMLVIAGAGFYLIGLPYAPLAAFLVATTNLVPYLGPMMGVVCAAGIALLQPGAALLAPTLAVIGVAVVLAGSVEIHPVIAALAVIALGQYFGMAGMLVAIPLASIVLVSIEIMYKQLKAFGVI
jgi:predicted PurR-regulated permease PerM